MNWTRENALAAIDSLTVTTRDGQIVVRDLNGGTWTPSEEAADEITAASDPKGRAIEICRAEPMRGTWQD